MSIKVFSVYHSAEILKQTFQMITCTVRLFSHFYVAQWQVFCIFKSLNKNPHKPTKGVNEEDFLRFYEVLDFRWTRVSC